MAKTNDVKTGNTKKAKNDSTKLQELKNTHNKHLKKRRKDLMITIDSLVLDSTTKEDLTNATLVLSDKEAARMLREYTMINHIKELASSKSDDNRLRFQRKIDVMESKFKSRFADCQTLLTVQPSTTHATDNHIPG